MPDKKFSSKAIVYSSSEDGLSAYLYGNSENGITDVSIPASFTKGAIRGDHVEVNVYIKAPRKRQRAVFSNAYIGRAKYNSSDSKQGYATVTSIIKPKELTLAGKIEEGGVHNMFVTSSGYTLRAPIFNSDMNGAEIGDLVLAKIVRKRAGSMRAYVVKVLGAANDFSARYKALLYNGGFHSEFTSDALQEAEILSAKTTKELTGGEPYSDYRSRNLFTLSADGEVPTKAYSFQKTQDGFSIGVYYSDAELFVKEGSALDEELFTRHATFELPNSKFTLFPELLHEKMRLKAGEDKPVFAIFLDIDNEGKSKELRFENALINVAENGTTSEVNELFSNIDKTKTLALEAKYGTIINQIWTMFDLCALLSRNKTYEFCQLDDINHRIYSFENGEPKSVSYAKPNDIDMMLKIIDTLVGINIARYASENNIPFVYETQLPPSYESIMSLPSLDTPLVVDETTISRLLFMYNFVLSDINDKKIRAASINMQRILPQVTHSTTPGNHYLLSCYGYTRFVNPCESYTDLTLLRIIKSFIAGNDVLSLSKLLKRAIISYRINGERMREAKTKLYNLLNERLAKQNGSLPVDVMISMVTSNGADIMLPNGAIGFVPIETIPDGSYNRQTRVIESNNGQISFGDKVKVIATDESGTIYKYIR